MKKIFAVLLCMCILLTSVPETAVKAAGSGASNWKLSAIDLAHTSVSFQISSVESAQDATLIIETADTYLNPDDAEKVSLEIPFSITSATEKISLDMPDGKFLPAGIYYRISVKDAAGNKSREYSQMLHKHSYLPRYKVYPNWVEVTNFASYSYNVTVTVGFKDYTKAMAPNETIRIEYPTQETGTILTLKAWDDYGCSEERTMEVEEERLNMPGLEVQKDCIYLYFSSLDENTRLGAEVEGSVYYSDYGVTNKDGEIIHFPQVAETTKKIKVWAESKNGSKTNVVEQEIEDCPIASRVVTCTAYSSKAVGNIRLESVDNYKITRVSTVIAGKEYKTTVKESGDFTLIYPLQEKNSEILLSFEDRHGCSLKETYTIHSNEHMENEIVALRQRAYDRVLEGHRIAVKIDDKVYYSPYAPETGITEVKYPIQKPGQKISVWYEDEDTVVSRVFDTAIISSRTYDISADVRVSSIQGKVMQSRNYEVYVKAGGREYKCATQKMDSNFSDSDEETTYDPSYYKYEENDDPDSLYNEKASGDYYMNFSGNFPKQKVGSSVEVIVRDRDGYETSKTFAIENIKPRLHVDKVDTSSSKVTGTTKGNSKITVAVGKKMYTGKANGSGKFSVKIKSKQAGTKVKVSVVTPDGYTNSKSLKIVKSWGTIALSSPVFRTSTRAKITVGKGKKGDKVVVKIAGKKYTKKLKSDKSKQKLSIKIKKASAGSKVKIVCYDKFGNKKDSTSDIVYYGTTIYKGMSAKNVVLTTWGYPVRRNDWGLGSLQWVFESGSTTVYAYIKSGKVIRIQKQNY